MADQSDTSGAVQARFDRIDVAELILRERLARDNRFWDEMASYYHEDSVVDVSWFNGSGAQFVEVSKKAIRPGNINFHLMTPPIVDVRGDRAISECPCTLRNFTKLDGVAVSYEGFVRLFWRAQRVGDLWLIAGLRCLYIMDMFHPRNPNRPPHFDEEKLETYRDSYRYLTVNLTSLGIPVREDLPGADRPESAIAMRESERLWLNQG